MKHQIIEALRLSLVPDSNSLKIATQNLGKMAQFSGFCYNSMQIVDDSSLQIFIRQAALTQCKNAIKRYWETTMTTDQKSSILNNLLTAFIRSAQYHLLLKLYKDMVCTIIGFEYKTWIPVQQILRNIRNNQNITLTLHFVIAICTNFEFSLNEEQKNFCYQFILTIITDLFQLVQRNQESQVIYLVIKIIWKTVHYEVSDQVRKAISSGMDLIITVFGAVNPQFQKSIQETQDRATPQFFYFHTKKWATRIIYRFIYRHANPSPTYTMSEQTKDTNNQFSKNWYNAYGQKVVDNLINQFSVPTIKKIRYFQLKCLQGLIKNQPDVMKVYGQDFQYRIIPPYLQLQPQDQQLADTDPVQFINKEEDPTINYTNLKKAATQVWLTYANLGSKKKSKGVSQEAGMFFLKNMQYIQSKLQGNNMLQKQMAMYLICQLRWSINNCKAVRKMLPNLISKYVVTQFTNQIMFLRARAIEIFNQYGDLQYPSQMISKAVEGIYFCLTGDSSALVRIKAAMAFHVLLNHEEARELVKPFFQQILKIYLQLLQKYDLELLVHSLTSIVEHFSLQIGPYAWQLMKYLSRHFIKLYHKDNEQSKQNDYDGETELAAAGILNTMKIILQSPIQKQIIQKMEDDILPVCEFVFGSDDSDYIDDVLSVLRAYTFKVQQISENLLFFYVIGIYYVMGIPQKFWQNIVNLPLSNQRIKALLNVKSGCNIQALDNVMPLLRNYLSKCSQVLFRTTDMFGVNLIELLFQMVNQIYEKGPNQFDGQVQMNSCTVLMIYLIENNLKQWPEVLINHIWQLVKQNLEKGKSKNLRSLNAQLICVLFWNCGQHIIVKAHQDNVLIPVFECIVNSETKIKQQHERQRFIFGISQLLSLNEKPNEMAQYTEKLFHLLISMVKKNAQLRINTSDDENYQTQSDDQQQLQNLIFGEDEAEDIWEQDFDTNYCNKLDDHDEIQRFKELMQTMKNTNNQLYCRVIQSVPQDDLITLNSLIEKAVNAK